jgi:YfiH family protein
LRRQIGRAAFAFSGRTGGISAPPFASLNVGMHVGDCPQAVQENRGRVLGELNVSSRQLVEAEQVHGARAIVVTEQWLREHGGERCVAAGADALVTSAGTVVLSLYFADCVPVFLAARSGRAIGLAHAGWRGTSKGVAAETVRVMSVRFGLEPRDLRAVIGPCIGPCCYEVGDDVMEAVAQSLPPDADVSGIAWPAEAQAKWMLDLAAANAAQLRHAGLPAGAIELDGRCTSCEHDTFFSVRADGRVTGRCGAFAYVRGGDRHSEA